MVLPWNYLGKTYDLSTAKNPVEIWFWYLQITTLKRDSATIFLDLWIEKTACRYGMKLSICSINRVTDVWQGVFFVQLGKSTKSQQSFNHLKTEFFHNFIKRFSSHLTGNKLSLSYKTQPVNAVWGKSRCLLWEPYGTHKSTVWAECGVLVC
jgi:hypothetical protein